DANAIDEYSLPLTSADQAPSRVVSGSRTGLDQPTGAALGSDGTLYVSNAGSNSVTEYAYGATGNETPVATISGADTGLDVPGKLAVDSSGYLFVTNNLNATVTEYAPGATGDAAPVATIGGFTRVGGIAAGDGVLEVGDSEDNIVEVYDDVSGAVSLTTTLGGTDTLLDGPTGLAIDGAGH